MKKIKRLAVDSMIFIYLLEGNSKFVDSIKKKLGDAEEVIFSTFGLAEVLTGFEKTGDIKGKLQFLSFVESYKNLIVWQKAVDLVIKIYKLTDDFPKPEIYGIVSQIRRSAISIPSNIAEGRRRATSKDFHHFLTIAIASGAELETQIIISKKLNFGKENKYLEIENLMDEIMKMLNKLINTIKQKY